MLPSVSSHMKVAGPLLLNRLTGAATHVPAPGLLPVGDGDGLALALALILGLALGFGLVAEALGLGVVEPPLPVHAVPLRVSWAATAFVPESAPSKRT